MRPLYRRLIRVWQHRNGTVSRLEKGPWEEHFAAANESQTSPTPPDHPNCTTPAFPLETGDWGSLSLTVGWISLIIVTSVLALSLILNWACNEIFLWRWRRWEVAQQQAEERRSGEERWTRRGRGGRRRGLPPGHPGARSEGPRTSHRDELDVLHERLVDTTTSNKYKRASKARFDWLVFRETEAHIDAMHDFINRKNKDAPVPPSAPNSPASWNPPPPHLIPPPIWLTEELKTQGTQAPSEDDRTPPSPISREQISPAASAPGSPSRPPYRLSRSISSHDRSTDNWSASRE